MYWAVLSLLPLTGLAMAALPWSSAPGVRLGVEIPYGMRREASARLAGIRYAAAVVAFTVLATGACCLVHLHSSVRGVWPVSVAILLTIAVTVLARRVESGRMISALAGDGRPPRPSRSSARMALVGEDRLPRGISPLWYLLCVPIVLATLLAGLRSYRSAPGRVPVHAAPSGGADAWIAKGPASLLIPLFAQVAVTLALLLVQHVLRSSKHPIDPARPVAAGYSYGVFAHAFSVLLLLAGLAFDAAMGGLVPVFSGTVPISSFAIVMVSLAAVFVIGCMVIALHYGQNGSRVFARPGHAAGGASPTVDTRSKGGLLYFDRDDPSLFVPRRFGTGWGMNWARPASWMILTILLAMTVLALVFAD